MEMPKLATKIRFDISSLLGPLFFLWLVQLPLPMTLVQLVYEKEKHLRMMMRMHGLSNGVYMVVTYAYFLAVYIIYATVMVAFGAGIGVKFFSLNDIGVQAVFFLLYGNVQVAFCFFLSCFFRSSRSAIVTGFLWVFASGLICLFLLGDFFGGDEWYNPLLELVPTFGAYRGLWELAQFSQKAYLTNGPGMTFGDVSSSGMLEVWIIFVVECPVFITLAWYLEQVLDSDTGVRKSWLFPLHALASCGARGRPGVAEAPARVEMCGSGEPDDVRRESEKAASTAPGPEHPIVVRDLRKVFPAADGNPKKVAVDNLSLVVPRGECFGLLGPNGAGKSTSINMMTGLLEASHGQAVIAGHDIASQMDAVYSVMGVCPQHDLLWETLTAREHLRFYGRLKGLSGRRLAEEVDASLRSVDLFGVGNKRCGKYSGGMKRRLSVAISLMGSPQVVYLDECSTGLDAASRRNLWDVVRDAKADKAIILTTHSMEEAEVLCDRLGIFVDGKLVCIGNPRELTSRYGGYYMLTISVREGAEAQAAAFVLSELSPNAVQTYAIAGTLKYEIPMQDILLSQVFARVGSAMRRGLEVLDWGVHNASLEDLFIQLASPSSGCSSHIAEMPSAA